MKKNTLTAVIVLALSSLFLHAQTKLTHIMSQEEKASYKNYTSPFTPTALPQKPVRNIAEFEPNEAVIIAYSGQFGIPTDLIRDLSNDGKLIVITSSTDQTACQNKLQSISGIKMSNIQYLNSTIDSYWTRDYTGWFIADGNNKVGIVDFKYNRPRLNDDAIPSKEASLLNITMYSMPVTHTGGNWMCDGFGTGTSTDLVWDDNTGISHAQIDQYVSDYLGISRHLVITDPQGQYIKHMDCFGKFLGVDKILIDSVPRSDPQFNAYETTAAYYASTNCAYGYKYKVYRPYTSGSKSGEPYSNSFICNKNVYVALKGTGNDNAALNLYKKAMPGYNVRGYMESSATPWESTDALHCRVHEIADREMLYINHLPLYGKACSSNGYTVSATALSYAGTALKAGYPIIRYRINGGTWDSIPMNSSSANTYTATIPTQVNGTKIEYYIKASDVSGKTEFKPYVGAADPFMFMAECTSGIEEPTVLQTYFNTYPNPSDGNFTLYLDSKRNCAASVKVTGILGQVIYDKVFNIVMGVNMTTINLTPVNSGIYFITYKTDIETITRRIIIK